MNDAFLPFDMCAKLVEAGMVADGASRGQFFWAPDGHEHREEGYGPVEIDVAYIDSCLQMDYTPAVTPLQALDWLVASGRIDAWELRQGECRAWDARPIATSDWCTWKQPTPTDLVRAILGMEVAQ